MENLLLVRFRGNVPDKDTRGSLHSHNFKKVDELVHQEPRFVENSIFDQWDRLGRRLPFETTASFRSADSLGVSFSS